MTITREDVADLREGDVVEYHHWDWPGGITVRGALYKSQSGCLMIGNDPIRLEDGDVRSGDHWKGSLTVVSRAPRPLYVNHPRTKPVRLDVVCDADAPGEAAWISAEHTTDGDQLWVNADAEWCYRADLPARLRLLVDGETGQVVPS